MSARSFSVRLYTPLPTRQFLYEFPLELEDANVQFSTALDAGFDAATIDLVSLNEDRRESFAREMGRVLARAQGFEHVEIWRGGVIWEGQLRAIVRVGGQPVRIQAVGYADALEQRVFDMPATGGNMRANDLLLSALRYLPFVRADETTVPGPTILTAVANYRGDTVRDVVRKILQYGNADGQRWVYFLWEGPVFVTKPIVVPSEADYVLDLRAVEETVIFDRIATRFRVSADIRDGNDRVTWETPWFVNDEREQAWGRVIDRYHAAGEVADRDTALRIARYLFERSLAPERSLRVLNAELRTPTGLHVPPWSVRAGQWVRVGEELFVIARTQFDESRGLSIELHEPYPTEAELLRRLSESVRALRERKLPLTGTRY